jgi:hypothetical protein
MTAAIKYHPNVKQAILIEVFSRYMIRCGVPFGKLRTVSETRFGVLCAAFTSPGRSLNDKDYLKE